MSLHIDTEYYCPACKCFYIPYQENIKCPNCLETNSDYIEGFVEDCIESCIYNLNQFQSFFPPAWMSCSDADELLYWLFSILEHIRLNYINNFMNGSRDFISDTFAQIKNDEKLTLLDECELKIKEFLEDPDIKNDYSKWRDTIISIPPYWDIYITELAKLLLSYILHENATLFFYTIGREYYALGELVKASKFFRILECECDCFEVYLYEWDLNTTLDLQINKQVEYHSTRTFEDFFGDFLNFNPHLHYGKISIMTSEA